MAAFILLFITLLSFLLVSQTHGICSPNIDYILNGKISYDPTYSFYKVSCDDGFFIEGKSVVLCENHEWNSPPPICTEYKFCSLPKELKHGTVIGCSSQILPRVDGKCSFKCNSGYTLSGPSTLTCTFSGQYVDEAGNENYPECIADHVYQSSQQKAKNSSKHNPCGNNLGGCQHICKDKEGKAECRCRRGHKLAEDEKNCVERTHSLSTTLTTPHLVPQSDRAAAHGGITLLKRLDPRCSRLQCTQLCVTENGRYRCGCERGYILDKEDKRTCNQNLGPPIHPLRSCYIKNGECDHKCSLLNNQVACSCNPGYDLAADGKTCNVFSRSPPVTSCAKMGLRVPCLCPPGYEIDSDGKHCVVPARSPPAASCNVDNGGCEHSCTMIGYRVQCLCRPGYKLDTDGKHCVDIDECKDERLNICHHICENTAGSYICHCNPGYVMIENYKCEGCRKHSYWSTEKNGCVDCPPNSYTVSDGKTSIRDCICGPGFSGNPRDDIPCVDINECTADNFGCSHICVNIPGGAFCTCPPGFKVDKDNKTCIDIDECCIKNGGCDGICHNTAGSFYCECGPGFVLSSKDQYSCVDVDECSENNGGCEQLCVNYRGGYFCRCEQGYRIDSSLKNCTDVSCQALPVPPFSRMACEKEGEIFTEMNYYPSGTVCKFTCMSGFKDASGSNLMKCKEGKWKGQLAECKAQRCPPLNIPPNGDIHPAFCAVEGNTVKQKCTFTCHKGYKLKGPYSVFNCKNNLTWSPDVEEIPTCQPEDIRASMECTRDVTVTLAPGKSKQNVTVPEPVTNMESYETDPENIIVGKPFEFEAGKTRIRFTASSPSSNRTAKCVTTVNVLDEEPPEFLSCPDSIVIENAKIDGEIVSWEEPEVVDNVKVESLQSSVIPNTTLTPGSYVVEYVATDSAGNAATCSFKIDIIRLNCDNLTDPANGSANCMDWLYGKLCQPQCDEGFMREPTHPMFYSCGDSGIWEPADVISDCRPYTEADSSECPEGYELKIIETEETEEKLCLMCPSNTDWSPTTRQCEETIITKI